MSLTLGHLDRRRAHPILRGLLRVVWAARHLLHVVRVCHHYSILMIIIMINMITIIIIMIMAKTSSRPCGPSQAAA